MTAVSDVRTVQSGWLVSRNVDAGFVLGGGVLLSAILFAGWRGGAGFLVAATLFAMFSDLPHVFSTSARIWLDPQERTLHGTHYAASLAAFGAAVTTLLYAGYIVPLVMAWTYWQVLHVVKQHYGMMSIYAAKARYSGTKKLAKHALVLGCAAPILYRMSHGLHFGEYTVFGYRMPFSNVSVPAPPVPAVAVAAVYAALAVVLVRLVREQRSIAAAGGRPLPGITVATLAVAVGSYNASYLLVDDLYALILIATTVHSLQYHVISWSRNNGRFERGSGADSTSLLARLSRRRALPYYIAFFLVVGTLLATAERLLLGAIPTTLVFHHFYFDGFVWKGRKNPQLARDLGIVPAGAGAGAATGPARPVPASA